MENFHAVLFVFACGLLTGGAAVYVLYARIAVVAARVEAEGAAAKRSYEDLLALFKRQSAHDPVAPVAAPVPPAA